LYELGLGPAIEWLGEQLLTQEGIHFEYHEDDSSKSLDAESRGPVYRSIRELLVNVIKHAKADKVAVKLTRKADIINIDVTDNGIGFDPDNVEKSDSGGGFGLFSVKERLGRLGAQFEINSKPGGGCRFVISVPVNEKDESN
jgi:signal transduction histidine kinase